jgi:hypothetical protein
MLDAIVALHTRTLGSPPKKVLPLRTDGSQRQYFRLRLVVP